MSVNHKIEISDGLIVDFGKSHKNRFKITLVNKGKRSVKLKRISSCIRDVNVVNFDINEAIIVPNGGEKEYFFDVESSTTIDSGKIRFLFSNRTHITRTVKIVRELNEKPHNAEPLCKTPNGKSKRRHNRRKSSTKSNEKSRAESMEIIEPKKPAALPGNEEWCQQFECKYLKGPDHSIQVSENSIVEFDRAQKCQAFQISIENTSKLDVQLRRIDINLASVQLNKTNGHVTEVKVIQPNEVLMLNFDVQFMPGIQSSIVFLKFHFDKITIKRSVKIVYFPEGCFDPRMLSFKELKSFYEPPGDLVDLISRQDLIPHTDYFNALDSIVPSINDDYERHFRNLLFLEEIGLHKEIKSKYSRQSVVFSDTQYQMENGKTIRRRYKAGQYDLEMPNLFETRPSLQLGDKIIARKEKRTQSMIAYEGKIIEIKDKGDLILVEFKNDFIKTFDNGDYSVEFKFSRSVYVRQHYALGLAIELFGLELLTPKNTTFRGRSLLDSRFSTDGNIIRRKCGNAIPWFNSQLNEQQKKAVYRVLKGDVLMPYLINGPPGTGKTTTLQEIILQIIAHIPNSRIIIATQSNSAANLITQRLITSKQLDSRQVLRLLSFNYFNRGATPDDISDYCSTYDDLYPDKDLPFVLRMEKVMEYRIVIGTSSTIAQMLESSNIRNYFTHAVIDEAGQCTELDVLIPMALVGKQGQTIMAGDQMQMPPLVIDQQANRRGLAVSMLTRLKEAYSKIREDIGFEEKSRVLHLVSNLVQNYRALPSILSYYNKQFYNSELIPMLHPETSKEAKLLQLICGAFHLKNATSGIHFIDVNTGKCGKWKNSWYNKKECEVVRDYALKLTEVIGLNQNDIGIISPYSMQVRALEKTLERHAVPDIKIGTVEDFQGLERKIILISTVRTSESEVAVDVKRQLGFVKCEKRINVAISRASVMVVVVGKAKLLQLDENWKALIDDCKANNTYREDV